MHIFIKSAMGARIKFQNCGNLNETMIKDFNQIELAEFGDFEKYLDSKDRSVKFSRKKNLEMRIEISRGILQNVIGERVYILGSSYSSNEKRLS